MSKTNTTQEIAIDFAQRAINSINGQLAVEIKRNGFSLEKIRKGSQKLERTVKVSESDPRHVLESFSISSNPIFSKKIPERIIMVVKWSQKGFIIERNSDTVANAVKTNPRFGIKKGQSSLFVGEVTEREIEIEARANKYEEEALEVEKRKSMKITK